MLTGTLGPDWLRKHGITGLISDQLLREWRDDLELQLQQELQLESDFALGNTTFFRFTVPDADHTIVEIEAFARRALDSFLDKESRRPTR